MRDIRTSRRGALKGAGLLLASTALPKIAFAEDAPKTRRVLVPTPIDTDRFSAAPSPHAGFRVGWIGSRSTRGYLDVVVPGLQTLIAARPDVVVAVMADAPPSQLDGVPIECATLSAVLALPCGSRSRTSTRRP